VKADRTKYRRALVCPHGVEKGRACHLCRWSDQADLASATARALSFYADPRNWTVNSARTARVVKHRHPDYVTPAELDQGRKARAALRRFRASSGATGR